DLRVVRAEDLARVGVRDHFPLAHDVEALAGLHAGLRADVDVDLVRVHAGDLARDPGSVRRAAQAGRRQLRLLEARDELLADGPDPLPRPRPAPPPPTAPPH